MRLLLVCFILLAIQPLHAAVYSVSSIADIGEGSLRQAIVDANGSGDVPHIILFAPEYPQSGQITLQSSLPVITASDVRVRGSDRSPVIDGAGFYSIFRAAQNVSLELEDLAIQQGLNTSGGCVATATNGGTGSLYVARSSFFQCMAIAANSPGGGAIRWNANSPALVTIEDSSFFENQAISSNIDQEQPRGGAIEISTNIIIRRSVFKDNTTNSAGTRGGYGGAVSLFLSDANGVSEITDSRFESNTTDTATSNLGWGGAIRAYQAPGGLLLVERNFFLDNQARVGGGIFLDTQMLSTTTQVSMVNNTFVENTAELDGGGIRFSDMEVFATHNTFYNNSGASGSHLSFERVKMRTLINNVLAATEISPACLVTDSSSISADFSGNLFVEDCGILSASGSSLSSNLEVQEVDVSERVGVAVFVEGADPIDGSTANPNLCAATDARGTSRPLDGDNDGTEICDVGAFEAPGDTLFKDGFEI